MAAAVEFLFRLVANMDIFLVAGVVGFQVVVLHIA
jgi:hypothetical protein